MLHMITDQLQAYLESICDGRATEIDESIIEEFGEKCKDTLRDFVNPQPFRVRMSNIGTGARKLYLDKRADTVTYNTDFIVKMTYGHIIEHFFVALLEACGVGTGPKDKEVTLKLPNGEQIKGTYDAKMLALNDEGVPTEYIFDFKTASEYSYSRKFYNLQSLQDDDSFGYVDQAISYSKASQTPFGGWFVINTTKGTFKIVDGRDLNNEGDVETSLNSYVDKLAEVNGDELPPHCNLPEPETFNKKETGYSVLSHECSYCPHKFGCFDVTYRPSLHSEAKNKPYVWYVDLPEELKY